MTRTKRALVVLAVLLLLPVGSRAEEPVTGTAIPIRIGYQDTPDWLLTTARELKLFEKEGLAPTWIKFEAGTPMIAAARDGRLDVADLGVVPFLIGMSQGVDWVLVGIGTEGAYSEGLAARKGSGIESIGMLRDKRIGCSPGSTAHYGLMMALRQRGIRAEDVTIVPMTPAEQLRAIASGDIDAAMVWEPWLQRMAQQADATVITTEGDLGIYSNVDGYAAPRDWLRGNKDTAVRFLRALIAAYEVLKKDQDVGVAAFAKSAGIPKQWANSIYNDAPPPNLYWWADRRYRYSLVESADFHRRLGYLANFLFEQKFIEKKVDVSDALDVSVIKGAIGGTKK